MLDILTTPSGTNIGECPWPAIPLEDAGATDVVVEAYEYGLRATGKFGDLTVYLNNHGVFRKE